MTIEKKNYERIIKSSSMIGGAQGINMLIGMLRVKFVAVLIGPLGVGLLATYQSIIQLTGTIFGLGLQASAVRDISQAVNEKDEKLLGQLILSLKRICLLSGVIGTAIVVLLSDYISLWTFGSSEHSHYISFLSLVILFSNLKSGQIAIIQGMRRIGDLAKLSIIGATNGTVISVTLYWLYGLDGMVPALVILSISEFCASWWFSRKVDVPSCVMTWKDSFKMVGGMFKLGLAFMWNGLLIAIVAYLTRTIISEQIDLVAVGIYSAAFSLSGLIVNFILGAMSADYYPSLTAISHDNRSMRNLVNQQTEIGLLLAIPGLMATLAFAPWLIGLFYSPEFEQSADLLLWFSIGCVGKVISWPLGFIILAKGRSKLFVITETIINIMHILLIITLLQLLGVEGVAIAFFILYFSHVIMMLVVSKCLIDFEWSSRVWKLILFFIPVILVVFISTYMLSPYESVFVGTVVVILSSLYCINKLILILGSAHPLYRLFFKFSFFRKLLKTK